MLLLTLGLTVMSWVLLAFMSGQCEGLACHPSRNVTSEAPEVPPLTIFVSVASYRDSECKDTMQACPFEADMPVVHSQWLLIFMVD